MSIVIPAMRGMLGGSSTAWHLMDDPNVVEAFSVFDTSMHSYLPPKNITQIVCSTATNDAIISCSGHGKEAGEIVTLSGIGGAFSSLNGEHTVVSAPDADTYTVAQGSLDGTEEYEAPLPTCDWKHKKVSSILCLSGTRYFQTSNVSLMPSWDDSAKELVFLRDYLQLSPQISGLIDGGPISLLCVYRKRQSGNAYPINSSSDGSPASNYYKIISSSTGFTMEANGGVKLSVSGTFGLATGAKVVAGIFTSTGVSLYVNDMVTPVASNSNDGSQTANQRFGINRNYAWQYPSTINTYQSVIFYKGEVPQYYREKYKEWAESQGVFFE